MFAEYNADDIMLEGRDNQDTTIEKDQIMLDIVDYVVDYQPSEELTWQTARYCLMDSVGCAMLSLTSKNCTKLLGPIIPGTTVPHGVIVPGTSHVLDPMQAAFNIAIMIRWLDYNDTWLAAEWGHPSDNLGAILSAAAYASIAKQQESGGNPVTMKQVLEAMVKAYEVQGVLALDNSFNQHGLDHVILVKVASTVTAAYLLGANRDQIFNALSNAWLDGGVLRAYRHYPNTGTRKSWAAGDQCTRAVWHALMALKGEMGYPTALSAPGWGFYDVQFGQNPFKLQRTFGEYVIQNVLYKVSFPAEFHAQTAVECALQLHEEFKRKQDQIKTIRIFTQKSAVRIITKSGPLNNPADRDHCLQYIVAVTLLYGDLVATMYDDEFHLKDKRIDLLREKMIVTEDLKFSKDYLDPEKRSVANSLQIEYQDGTFSQKVTVEYPIGHRRRREEALPLVKKKFVDNMKTKFDEHKVQQILELFLDKDKFESTTIDAFMQMLQSN